MALAVGTRWWNSFLHTQPALLSAGGGFAGLSTAGGVRLCCCAHRGVSEHVGHTMNSSSLVTRQGNKVSFWAGYPGVSWKYSFAVTKEFFLGLWKQKNSIGIETYSLIGWISKVIIHGEGRLRSWGFLDCTNMSVSYAQAFVPLPSTEKVWDKE